ncbi:porin [Sulfurovum sp. zt1-1]|uniref:Porin n=1 Tax=Sulfurovum zhangzhouensis TaxID=3019067 RepID=A0ABT7QZE4_9BACT|nr:porin [Sulfurovum zhangzhouensis]MDM5271611.1 porin [Sulfurovum zhangzhouensis]
MKNTIKIIGSMALLTTSMMADTLEERLTALEETNKTLTEELLATQTGGFTLVESGQSYNGLGDAASKVYYSKNPLSIGGYGEMYYANPEGSDDYADVYRFITYLGYKFSDNVILNTEIEFEHGANAEDGGEVVLEFMYLDFLMREEINLRLGHLLVPMGLINLRHEPTLFNTVQRPEIEQRLIPSTWHENGALLYGRFADLGIQYTAGIVNALNVDSDKTATADSGWIRSGRLGAANKASFSPAFVGRLDYTGTTGLMLGASVYYGDGSNLKDDVSQTNGLTMTMFDIHASYENGPFELNALYTQTNLDGAEKLSSNAVEKASGYYVNASYNLSGLLGVNYKMPVFGQYQNYNPVEQTVDGSNENAYQTEITTIGVNFFPADQAVIKVDYAMKEVNNVEENIVSLGIGFIF